MERHTHGWVYKAWRLYTVKCIHGADVDTVGDIHTEGLYT